MGPRPRWRLIFSVNVQRGFAGSICVSGGNNQWGDDEGKLVRAGILEVYG